MRWNLRLAVFEPLFKALNNGGVRSVVVGGLAVVLHGYPRMTVDVDLAVDLDDEEARKAIDVRVATGLHPRVPVDPGDFSDRSIREEWIRDRGMQLFSMFDPSNPMRMVDLFVAHPVPFEESWSRPEEFELGGATVRVASIPDLIQHKRLAGRAQDLADIERLEAILMAKKGEPMAERPGSDDRWDATWEGSREQLLESTLAATPAQRLAWLEELLEIARRAGSLETQPARERS